MKIINLSATAIAIMVSNCVQANENAQMEVSAKIEPGCFLEADNINFGILQMPLSDQSAQSNIKIKCSKNSNVELTISYLGIGGGNASNDIYTSSIISNQSDYQYVKIYKNNAPISSSSFDVQCLNYHTYGVTFSYQNAETASLLGLSNSNINISQVSSPNNICDNKNFRIDKFNEFLGAGSGILTGLLSNEKINYYVEKPTTNEPWTSSYQVLSSGTEQIIPMKTNIKRADNPTYRMTPDTYQSTLSIILTY